MAIYSVSPALGDRITVNDATAALVVSAGSVADARSVCKQYRAASISDAAWDAATVTQLIDINANGVNATQGMTLRIQVPDAPNDLVINATGVLCVESAAIGAGGTGYSVNDILTPGGGTSTRAATFRVTSETGGVVDGIELVGPGHYSVLPTGTQSTTVSPAGGTGCTLSTFTGSATTMYSLLTHAVTLLNAHVDIANAAVDMGAAPPLLTVAGAADNLGDKTVTPAMFLRPLSNTNGELMSKNGVNIAGLIGTVTHQGAAGAALTVEFPELASAVIPRVLDVS